MTLSENNQPPSTQVDKEHQRSSDRMDKDQVDRLFHRYKSTKEELEGWRLTVNG